MKFCQQQSAICSECFELSNHLCLQIALECFINRNYKKDIGIKDKIRDKAIDSFINNDVENGVLMARPSRPAS